MWQKRSMYLAISLVLLLLAAAGCANKTDKPAADAGKKTASGGETIKIGWFGPLSGPASLLGQDSLRGAQFAIKEFNSGGAKGKQVELVHYDDRGDKKEAVSIAERLIGKDNVAAVVGGSTSPPSVAAAAEISKAKVPMVAAIPTPFRL